MLNRCVGLGCGFVGKWIVSDGVSRFLSGLESGLSEGSFRK